MKRNSSIILSDARKFITLHLLVNSTKTMNGAWEELRRWGAWLRRLGRGRGFGIQSPTAYTFVTDVLCQPMPYYAYDELAGLFPRLKGRQRRLCQMLFRLANHQQAAKTFVTRSLPDEYREYLLAAHRRTTMSDVPDGCKFVVVSESDEYDSVQLTASLPDDAILVVTDIRKHHEPRLWPSAMADERVGMTFDVFDAGVAVFGEKRHRQHYSVNL